MIASNRILVVEDHGIHLYIFRQWLTAAGYEVDAEPSPADAKARLAERRYGVAVVDCQLPNPRGDKENRLGLEFCRYIAEHHADLPMIVMSTYPELLSGARDIPRVRMCLQKPIAQADLYGAVRGVLGDAPPKAW